MNAPRSVLSDEIAKAIQGRRVVAAVFTTFTFHPEFFELEILPLLFDARFSHVDKVRRVQLEECLRDGADVAVYYDRSGLVGGARSAMLDFRRIDVSRNGIFHPKMVLLLVEDQATGTGKPTRRLIVATLSSNLRRSGWWENVETGCVKVVRTASRSNWRCTFRRDLLFALGAVADAAHAEDRGGALETIQRFLREEAPRRETRNASWRGRYYERLFAGQKPLPQWLADRKLHHHRWNLEIVSPFFDEHGAGALKALVDRIRPQETRVFLPTNGDGTPTVTSEQFDAVAEFADWGRLPATLTRASGQASAEGVALRRVHAKVYRFWRRGESDIVLVGSVNLTRPAHSEVSAGNLEAAFLVNTPSAGGPDGWWLEPLDESPEQFTQDVTTEDHDRERIGLDLSLRYHWERGAFEYRLDSEYNQRLDIETIAGKPLATVSQPKHGQWQDCGPEAAESVSKLLKSTSFVLARTPASGRECKWRVLVREEGMTHKPSLLTQLTPDEILQYWSLLSVAQRREFLADRLETDQDLLGLRSVGRRSDLGKIDTVFDRFSGVFHAFERFRCWVDDNLSEGNEKEVTARVFGEKYDSLPVLLRKTLEPRSGDAVIPYVTFLSAKQIAAYVERKWPGFWGRHADDGRTLNELLNRVSELRAKLPVTDPDRKAFLDWYEKMFATEAANLENADGGVS